MKAQLLSYNFTHQHLQWHLLNRSNEKIHLIRPTMIVFFFFWSNQNELEKKISICGHGHWAHFQALLSGTHFWNTFLRSFMFVSPPFPHLLEGVKQPVHFIFFHVKQRDRFVYYFFSSFISQNRWFLLEVKKKW